MNEASGLRNDLDATVCHILVSDEATLCMVYSLPKNQLIILQEQYNFL